MRDGSAAQVGGAVGCGGAAIGSARPDHECIASYLVPNVGIHFGVAVLPVTRLPDIEALCAARRSTGGHRHWSTGGHRHWKEGRVVDALILSHGPGDAASACFADAGHEVERSDPDVDAAAV
jgi:hypothetical protein